MVPAIYHRCKGPSLVRAAGGDPSTALRMTTGVVEWGGVPKHGEIAYLSAIGPDHARHAIGKPFSDIGRAELLMQVASIFALLPPPPCALLHLGCGTGWASIFFARSGYAVTAVDIAPDMIAAPEANQRRASVEGITFVVGDFETLDVADFDAVVFYDALHHAEDEVAALRTAYRSLRAGGYASRTSPVTAMPRVNGRASQPRPTP